MSGTTLPTVFTSSGLQPQAPADLNTQVIALATAYSPGLTATLPGSLIEDLSSTATAALVVIDQARVDLIASVSPNAANPYILNLLGQMYGVQQGVGTNTGVYVVFTAAGTPGYVIPSGFVVSDGTYQYTVQDAGVIGVSGSSQPLSCIATQAGTWAVPVNTVTQIVTSYPSTIRLTCTNPLAGSPGVGSQTVEDYRSQVLQAGQATFTGSVTALKTTLANITGVNATQISIRAQTGGGWEVIVGGSGDPYQIGFAILSSLFDPSTLVGSINQVTNITNASVAVVTTSLNHGYTTGQNIVIKGATGLTVVNGVTYSATVLTLTSFSIPLNTTASGTYTGGGVVTPNFRNVTTSLYVPPDTYTIPFVIPPSQNVSMVVTWNTSSTGYVNPSSVAAAAQPALVAYVNSVPVGQPMNLFALQETFQQAVSSLIPQALLTRLVFAISINGIAAPPQTGTFIISGDPESFFTTTAAAIQVNQG